MSFILTSATPSPFPGIADAGEVDEREEALLEASMDAVLRLSGMGIVRSANLPAVRLFAGASRVLVGRALLELFRPDGRSALARLMTQAAVEGRARAASVQVVRPDGSEAAVELSLSAVGGGVVRGGPPTPELWLVARDVGERARVERQLRDNERLVTIGTLAAGIAHEIANPTAYVLANLTLLRSYEARFRESIDLMQELAGQPAAATMAGVRADLDALLSELDEVVRESEAGGERIRGIVSDLKAFSRAEDAGLSRFRVDEEIESVLRLLRSELRYRATVRRDYAPQLPEITAHRGRISQLLVNLVLNAAQAMDRVGSAEHVLTVTTRVDGEGVRIEVSDTGPGIAPEVMPHIFEPFFTTKPAGKGTGLGLSISRDIARRHGGELSAQSTPGRGATFVVWLPVAPPPSANPTPAKVPSVPTRIAGASEPAGERRGNTPTEPALAAVPMAARRARSVADELPRLPSTHLGHRTRVLVVDDEPHLLAAYTRVLGGSYDLTTAPNGRVARELIVAAQPPFDVVISDLVMPELDGVGLHEAVGGLSPGLERRMIFVTGGASTERAARFLDRVDNPRLEKPISTDELFQAIEAILGSGGVPS